MAGKYFASISIRNKQHPDTVIVFFLPRMEEHERPFYAKFPLTLSMLFLWIATSACCLLKLIIEYTTDSIPL